MFSSMILNAQDVRSWESKPGSQNVIFLQMDGGNGFNNVVVNSLSDNNKRKEIYETVVEDFYLFDVNVTTNKSVFDNTLQSNRVGILIGTVVSGIAWGRFGDNNYYHSQASSGVVAVHELGHNFSLSHDGSGAGSSTGYLEAKDNWAPALGADKSTNTGAIVFCKINHWYNGYKDPSHTQEDDIAVIGSYLGYINDDYISAYPLRIEPNGIILSDNNPGGIHGEADTDEFYFITSGGAVNIEIAPNSISHPNLIVGAVLKNEQGLTVATGTVSGYLDMGSNITETLSAGKYYLEIDGVGIDGTCSDYGSWGPYKITGSISNHQTINVTDLALTNLKTPAICNSGFAPEITVFNSGTKNITNFSVDVFVEGTKQYTELISANLTTAGISNFTLPFIYFSGDKEVKIMVHSPNNTTDGNASNNQLVETISLREGDAYALQIDAFYIDPAFDWSLTNKTSNHIVANKSTYKLSYDETYNSTTDICLTPACYELEIDELFKDIGTCNYPMHVHGGTYNSNDHVLFEDNGQYVIYKAKWWTTSEPGTDSAWELIGPCNMNEASDFIRFIKKSDETELVKETANTIQVPHTEDVCIGSITNILKHPEIHMNLYPNPVKQNMTVEVSKHDTYGVTIRSVNGSLIHQSSFSGNQWNYDFTNLESGVYFIVLNSSQKIINQTFTVVK